MNKLLLLLLLVFSHSLFAMDPTDYRSAEEEQRFRSLAAELRCVMCQNQSLADSNGHALHRFCFIRTTDAPSHMAALVWSIPDTRCGCRRNIHDHKKTQCCNAKPARCG